MSHIALLCSSSADLRKRNVKTKTKLNKRRIVNRSWCRVRQRRIGDNHITLTVIVSVVVQRGTITSPCMHCQRAWSRGWSRSALFILRPCQHDDGYMDGRSQIKVHTDERTQVHSARSSLTASVFLGGHCHNERYYLHGRAVSIICQHVNKLCTPHVAGGIGLIRSSSRHWAYSRRIERCE